MQLVLLSDKPSYLSSQTCLALQLHQTDSPKRLASGWSSTDEIVKDAEIAKRSVKEVPGPGKRKRNRKTEQGFKYRMQQRRIPIYVVRLHCSFVLCFRADAFIIWSILQVCVVEGVGVF